MKKVLASVSMSADSPEIKGVATAAPLNLECIRYLVHKVLWN